MVAKLIMEMRILIPLIKLDSFYPEDVYIEGEKLYDSNGIQQVNELYKGKVMMVMSDGNKVEIRFNKDNIVDLNCTCQEFKIKKVCAHVVACSLEVRKLADKFAKKKPVRKLRVSRTKNNLFEDIINVLEKSELIGFMSSYAKKDKSFRLFFEAFFLNKLKNKNLENSYASLLDEVLPPSSNIEVKFSRQQISLLNDIASDLLNQYKDEISLNKYTDAFNIIKHLINKLSYAYNRSSNDNLAELLNRSHQYFYLLFDETLAPELKKKTYDFINEMIGKSYYFYQKENDLLHLFLSTNPIREDMLSFVQVLKDKIKVLRDENAKKYFIAFYIGILKRLGELENDWYEIYFKDLTDFMEISHLLLSEGYGDEFEKLLEELYEKEKISKRLYLESQLRVSILKNDCERIGFLILDIYESTFDFRYLKRVRKCFESLDKKILEQIDEIIEINASDEEKLEWWLMTKNFKKLVDYLLIKNDIASIQYFEKDILDNSADNIERLYLNYIHEYLNSHFGQNSVTVVKNLLFHLRQIGAKKIAFNIEKDLFESFSSRKRFLKDLMGI